MKLRFRKLRKDEEDYELVFGVLIIPLSFIFALVITRLPAHWAPYCLFRRATGIPCPACGSFRSVVLLSRGYFTQAWITQPLMATLILMAILFMIYSWIVVLFRLPRLRLEETGRHVKLLLVLLIVTVTAANWIYLLIQAR